jgi:hypothetical protein
MANPSNWTPEQRAQLIDTVRRGADEGLDAETLAVMRIMLELCGLPDTREIRMAMLLGATLAMIEEAR